MNTESTGVKRREMRREEVSGAVMMKGGKSKREEVKRGAIQHLTLTDLPMCVYCMCESMCLMFYISC